MTAYVVVMGIVSWWTGLDPTVVAAIFTILGGFGLKAMEHWLTKHNVKRTERQDADKRLADLQDRLDKVEKEVDEWRNRFYAQQEHILVLKSMMLGAGLTPPDPK